MFFYPNGENGRKKTKKTGKNTQTSWVENRREPK